MAEDICPNSLIRTNTSVCSCIRVCRKLFLLLLGLCVCVKNCNFKIKAGEQVKKNSSRAFVAITVLISRFSREFSCLTVDLMSKTRHFGPHFFKF